MRNLILALLFLPLNVLAVKVEITEIQPLTISQEPEWFEFRVSDTESINFNQWSIGNGKIWKKVSDFEDNLLSGKNAEKIENLHYKIIDHQAYFSWKKSPTPLPDAGGEIAILDAQETIVAQALYPKTRSGKGWHETWNLEEKGQYLPLLHKSSGDPHSKNYENSPLPTNTKNFKIAITEVSPKNINQDFIEITIISGPPKINLKYLSIKHNGTTLWNFNHDFWVKPKERLIIYFNNETYGLTKKTHPYEIMTNRKAGLSSGSGTIELIAFSKTSFEIPLNFWCWKDKKLSQTEGKRVDRYRLLRLWEGPCYEISELITNQSVGLRNESKKAFNINHLFDHFNGSPGSSNEVQNQPPLAKIEIQGSKKSEGKIPFSLNVNGGKSQDPDGYFDIKNFEWTLDGKIFSQTENPKKITINSLGEKELTLVIQDHSGAKSSQKIIIKTYDEETEKKKEIVDLGSSSSSDQKTKKNSLIQFKKTKTIRLPSRSPNYPPVEEKELKVVNHFKHYNRPKNSAKRLIQLPKAVRQRVQKNIGIIFTWRESPWPGLAAESTFDEVADQKFARFEAGYLGAVPAPYKKPLVAGTRFSERVKIQ